MSVFNKSLSYLTVALFAVGLAGCATQSAHESSRTDAASQQTTAASQSDDTTKAAFGVRKPRHISVATMTARQMLAGEAEVAADRVVIVACGPAIRALADDSDRADTVRQGLESGVDYKACGVTVERMNFDASTFIDGVDLVPNGFVELIRLQKEGFHSMEL